MAVGKSALRRGRLIVFEGIDGSGKSTQVKLFPADFKLAFPRYQTFVGRLIRLVLTQRRFSNLNPYLVACLFAFDRFLAKPTINHWLKTGKNVAIDRYTFSSMAHQGAKLEGEAQKRLIGWIDWLENKLFKLPQADRVIYLNVPPQVTRKLMRLRRKDLAEADFDYQQKTAGLYQNLAKKYRFTVIDCLGSKKRLLSKSDVKQKVAAAAG